MSRIHQPSLTLGEVREFLEWLLLQLELLENEKSCYESRAGEPYDERHWEAFERVMASGNTNAIRLLDIAGVEWVKTKAGPLRKNVEEFLDSHGLREHPEPEYPAKVVVFDPSRVRNRPKGEEGEGAAAPGKDAA